MKFDQEYLDALNDRLRPLVHSLAYATAPICQPGRRGLVTPAGSGIFLQIEDRRYLLTASHVFENAAPDKAIAAIAGKRFVVLPSDGRWRTKPTVDGVPDPVDLAVVHLDASHDEGWLGIRFIGLSDIDPFGADVELAPSTSFLALGYPRSKQPKVLRDGSYAAFAYHFLTHFEPIQFGSPRGAVPHLHIAVGYDRRGFVGDPAVSEMAVPDGMSGGGLWRIPHALTAMAPKSHLVGILIEHHIRPKVILASRIAEVLRFLRTLDSANAAAIDRHFPGLEARAT